MLPPQVLSVSACSVQKWLKETYSTYGSKTPLLTVHLGVDAKATCFKLEHTAYNNATFRVPDVEGYQPYKVRICPSMALDEPLSTDLPLEGVIGMMMDADACTTWCTRMLCNIVPQPQTSSRITFHC